MKIVSTLEFYLWSFIVPSALISTRFSSDLPASAKKYKQVRYNKAALAFIETGSNDLKNPRYWVETVIASSADKQLLLLSDRA